MTRTYWSKLSVQTSFVKDTITYMQAHLAIYDQADCFEIVVDNICLTKLFWSTPPFIISGSILK